MMSFLTVSGFVAYGLGGLFGAGAAHDDDDDDWFDSAETETGPDDLLTLGPADLVQDATDFARGDTIPGVSPDDLVEIEYSRSLGAPEVTVTDLPDGSGAQVALNGVVVADLPGAAGFDPSNIILVPV
jgi:hypothetical protein